MTIGLADRILQNDVSTFVAALDQAAFHEELERLCVSEWRCGAPRDVHVEPVRAHRNRCTLEIALTTVSGPRRLIGKVYADDRLDAFRAMRAVRRAGFGPDSAFSIARPLAWLPVLGVRLEEKVEGPSVKDIILTGGSAEWTAAAERCGTWLARFHCLAPTPQTGSDLLAALAHSREAVTRMTGLRPKAEALLRRLEEAAALASPVPRRAGHGSYIPEHVILSGASTVVIDLDDYDAADPARDVAWFLVALQRRAIQLLGSRHVLTGAADAFIRAYATAGPQGALANLQLYRALMCLRHARRDLDKQTPELAEFMIDEALRLMSH